MNIEKKFNKKFRKKLNKAIEYLKSIGCTEIILFGSLSDETFDDFSDIDLAVSGISPSIYFKTVAVLPSIMGGKLDLVSLDYITKDFKERIRNTGKKIYAI